MEGINSYVVASPIYGSKLKNVAITGEGILDVPVKTGDRLKKQSNRSSMENI